MTTTATCDYCGDTIETRREHTSLIAFGNGCNRDYHRACWPVVQDALDAVSGARKLTTKEAARQANEEKWAAWREEEKKWRALSFPQREHLLVEVLGDGRMPVAGFVAKVQEAFGEHSVSYGNVYPVLRRLCESGELDGVAEPFRGTRTRTVYFRREMAGPDRGPRPRIQRADRRGRVMAARHPHGTGSLKLMKADKDAPKPLTGDEVYEQIADFIAEHLPSIPFDDPSYVTLHVLSRCRRRRPVRGSSRS